MVWFALKSGRPEESVCMREKEKEREKVGEKEEENERERRQKKREKKRSKAMERACFPIKELNNGKLCSCEMLRSNTDYNLIWHSHLKMTTWSQTGVYTRKPQVAIAPSRSSTIFVIHWRRWWRRWRWWHWQWQWHRWWWWWGRRRQWRCCCCCKTIFIHAVVSTSTPSNACCLKN